MTRIYLPATTVGLTRLRDKGELTADRGHAVTPGLREWYTEGDEEDLEYVAFTRAAQDSLPLLAQDPPGTPPRRVVVSVELPDSAITPEGVALGASTVRLTGPVPRTSVAAIHVDGTAAETDVIVARDMWQVADSGDADAQFLVEAAEDHELEWYDPTELDVLLARLVD